MLSADGTGVAVREWADQRRLISQQRVAPSYEIRSGCVAANDDREGRWYHVFAAPAALSEFLRVTPGDSEAALRYSRRWGLLGFDAVSGGLPGGRPWIGDRADPLPWVWVHANGIRLGHELIRCIRDGDESGVEVALRTPHVNAAALDLISDVFDELDFWSATAGGDDVDEGDRPQRVSDGLQLFEEGPESINTPVIGWRNRVTILDPGWIDLILSRGTAFDAAVIFLGELINPHLPGVSAYLDGGWRASAYSERPPQQRFEVVTAADSLISVLYWHLLNLLTGSVVRACENEDCRALFTPSDARQRFCSPPPGSRVSLCRDRYNKRKRRHGRNQ